MMTDRDVMVKAAAILAEHGALTPDYIIDQLGDVLGDLMAVEDWRRVAAAADAIVKTTTQ